MLKENHIRALKGAESLLLILPKEAATKLDIANQERLKFEVKNGQLVIRKIKNEDETSQASLRGVEL